MCYLRHRLRIFLFRRKIMFCSQGIQVFVFLAIPWVSNELVMMSISTWGRVYFWINHLNHNLWTHQTWSIDRCKQGQYFPEIFWMTWRTGTKFQALFNLATCSNYLITNYVKIPVFHFFERVDKGELKC